MADAYPYQEEQYDGEEIVGSDDGGEYSDDDSQGDNGSLTQSGNKAKHKRRSKNDNQGRDFRCGCGKRYLSYPALYTHIKTKHGGQTPSGTNTSQFQTGRGRGRPRKITKELDADQKLMDQNMVKPSKNMNGGPLSSIEEILTPEKLFNEQGIIDKLKVEGGPTHTNEWFYEPVDVNNDEIYNMVQDLNQRISLRLRQLNIDISRSKSMVSKATIYLFSLSDEEKNSLRIDSIMALYLNDLAEHVIVNFYKAAAVFITLYRNCINETGWDKMAGYKRLDNEGLAMFTSIKEADMIPEFCNDFVVEWLPLKCNVFERTLAVNLVRHFCIWLYNRGLTQYKVSRYE